MNDFWKVIAGILLTAVLCLTIGTKEISTILSMIVCCMAAVIAISYLKPVFDFLYQLETLGNLKNGMLDILLKSVGIGVICELTGRICSDAGKDSLAKMMQMLASASILYLSIPVFRALLTLIQEILGDI